MSDFFIQNPEDEEQNYTTTVQKPDTQVNQNPKDYNQIIQDYKTKKRQHYADAEEYGVELPDGYYDAFRPMLTNCETQEERQELAYKIGTAAKYSELTGEPLLDAFENVDAYNKANFPNLQNQKSWYEATKDMIAIGNNNVKLGNLGQQLMKAHLEGDEELAAVLMAEIDSINQRNETLQQHVPDRWWKEAVEAGATSIPFTGAVVGAGIIGNFLSPAVGKLAATTTSSYLMAGQEYIDMIANGSTPETARSVAKVSGIIQGLIESDFGITKGILKGTARLMGKEAGEKAAKRALNEIGSKFYKRFHFGPGKKIVTNFILNYGKGILGEGYEEAAQNVVSVLGKELAAAMDGYDIPEDDLKSIVSETMDQFKGGMLGAVFLGIGPAGLNAAADVAEYAKVKKDAQTIESEEALKNKIKNSPLFKGMSEENRDDVIHDIFEKEQQRKEEAMTAKAKQIAEGLDAAEGAEERKVTVDENGNEVEEDTAEAVARDEKGRLFVQDEEYKNDEGKVTGGKYWAGNANVSGKEEGNRYGYITYSQDENGDITIDTFKMTEGREGLRQELFEQFAQEHPDVKIEWNAIGSDTETFKQQLIDNNPSGAKNGLNYYTTQDLNTIQADKRLASIIRDKFHNFKYDDDGNLIKTDFTTEQTATGVTLFNLMAKNLNVSVDELLNNFVPEVVRGSEELGKAIDAHNQEVTKEEQQNKKFVTGAFKWAEVEQGVKAVIYAGEYADFSTLVHELAHFYQSMLTGDLKKEAEKAFNVVKGDWLHSKYTFKDGRTMSSKEAFAYALQDYLTTGKAENEQMQTVLQRFVKFLADAYNRLRKSLTFTPEIENVFNKLLDGDDTIMSKALKAAEEEDKEWRANLKRQAEVAEDTKKAEAEEAQKQAALEKEEASEYTDYEQETTQQSAEEIEQQLEESNEKETGNAIDDALENTNFTDEQKAKVSEVLNDETTTTPEKANAIVDAAGEQFDLFQSREILAFQLAGEPSIRRMAESEERTRILNNLEKAKELDEKYGNVSQESKAAAIRRMTNWEKDATGNWKYELDDSINRIKSSKILETILNRKPEVAVIASQRSLLNLGDIYDAPELYKVFPYMKNVRVSFYLDNNAFRSVLTGDGIKINARYLMGIKSEKGLKGALVHEIQHVIQTLEYAESNGVHGADIEELFNEMKAAIQAVGQHNIDYDFTSVENALQNYMENEGEIEARNVARRVLMNADERLYNTLASTEDVKRDTDLAFQNTPEEIQTAETYLDTFKSAEKKRVKNNLEKFKDTSWYNVTIKSLNARNDINALLDGKELAEGSVLKNDFLKSYYDILTAGDTKKERIENLYEYFDCKGSLIGHPSKPINSVASSFVNCNPSKECAQFCYAANGRNQMLNLIVNRELVNWCIEHDPARAARMVADEYKVTREFKNGVALRLLDTGDLSAPWLDFIKELNDRGISCQIFSKRPDLLKQVDQEKNVVLLSIDNSNTDVAKKYPDLPIAYVYSGVQDIEYIKNNEERFKKYNGVILPVVMNRKRLSAEEINALPAWSKNYTCPIDAGWKEIGNNQERKYNTDKWNCSVCDINGQGCFFARAVKDRKKFYATLKEVPIGVLNAITEEYEKLAASKLSALGLSESDIGSILAEMVNIRNQKLAGIDTEGTDTGLPGNGGILQEASGETEGLGSQNGSQKKSKTKLDTDLLFQTVYHGSGANFDKFDVENYGLSGEGSMSFGYGTYLTDSEEIARDYAERGGDVKWHYFYKGDELTDSWDPKLGAAASLNLNNNDVNKSIEDLLLYIKKIESSEKITDIGKKSIDYYKGAIEVLEKSKPEDFTNKKETTRNLYTADIPDDGYIVWDKDVDTKTKKYVEDAVFKKLTTEPNEDGDYVYKGAERELREELHSTFGADIDGQSLYNDVVVYLGDEKAASIFLNNLGFVGINYPAYSNFGNAMGKTARNFVIFNDDDIKIIDHLLFQTNAELMQEAQNFDSWQDFMEFCEVMHGDDEISPIPSEADAQWYQSFWETSHGLQTEQEKNEQTVEEKNEKDTTVAKAMDALFVTYIRQNPEMLDDFLHEAARIDAIDLDSDEWRNVEDDMDAAQRDRIDQLKDAIAITMSDYNWQSAMRRVQGGGEISEGMRKRLMGEMTDTMKSRDFRALYAEVMEDPQYAVDEQDTTAAILSKKLQKYQKRYYDIVKPGEDISKMSPEKRKRIAEAMANRDIANKIRNGSLKLDDELDAYIKSLDAQIKEKQKQFDELEKETKADYQRIADAEKRRLLKLHDELLMARSKVTQKNSDTARKINKGLKITEKYKRESQNLQANYDELFRKFNDLKNTIQITAEVQAALDRQEQVATVREDLNAKQKEKNLTAEVKKMRIQLVKKTMRRVPFNRIDFENARTVIAIQRMLEPNLIGGVNRFIGVDSAFLRGVISQVVTDSEYKEKLLNYLNKNSRASEAFVNFKKKLTEMKSIKDFDSWTAKERKAAIKYLPKENWIRDLNLKELAKEREESIDLDIDTEEYSRPVYDENGKPKTYKDADGIEHNVTETAFRLRYSDELGQLVKDAVGADMFDRIVNRPFSEWTTEELEQLAQRIDELYTEGRDLLAAKNEAKKREAEAIRKRVEDAIKDTGIVINDDDTPEEKERKQKEINKILNLNSGLKGTEAGKEKGIKAKLDRLIHGYSDMNVLRFARMLDNQSDGENVYMLYRREDECYNNKTRSINNRARAINEIMKANNITEGDLARSIPVASVNTEFTVDELLYFLAADKDYAEDEVKLAKGLFGLDANDDWAATSRNAVMFGNMMSDTASQKQKEEWAELDKQMKDAIENDTLTTEQKQLLATNQLDKTPGTSAYIAYCHAKWEAVLSAANSFLEENPKYVALMEAIEADYASQYERMNEVSINEFNMPVHRVRAYVPLVRRESNGDTNVNQVKEDLLGAYGAASGKQWVNKGMTQRRVNISPLHQKPVQTGLFATWGSSVDRTEHFIAYAPYVRQLNAVYKSRDASYTRRFIESRYGKGAVQYLDNYINEVANPNAGKVREAGAEWLHTFRGRTAPAYLGWKFSAIIKQGLTSPWPYMQFVNPAEYASAALECTRKGTYDAIKEKSVFMNNRVMDPMNELVEEMADEGKTKFDRALGKFGKTGMQGLEWIDWVCVAPGWLACYKKEYARLQRASEARYEAKMEELRERNMYADIATSEYMTPDQMEAQARKEIMEDIEVEAVRYADDCTRQCQPSSRAADLAPLFKNSSEAMKAFLQFQTSLNVIWQNIRYDMPYAVRNKQFQRIVGTILGYVFAGIFMNSVMEGVTSGAKDDDDKDLQALRNLIFYSTTQFTDAVPIMGSELTNMMDQVITGKRGFMNSGTDMTPSATKMLSAFTNATKGNWEKAAELSAEAIGMAAGAPVSGTKEIYKLLGKPLKEGDVNLKRGISDVYGIAGDIIEE